MSQNLNTVVAKIDASNSNLNLYRNLTQSDRIILNSTPCDQNAFGSCKGLVSSFTQPHFQAFDLGRDTYQNEAQLESNFQICFDQCYEKTRGDVQGCNVICKNKIEDDQTKDFI
jgi:hypothetical protein